MPPRKAKDDYVVVNIRIPRDLHDVVLGLAEISERSFAAEVRMALRQYLESKGSD